MPGRRNRISSHATVEERETRGLIDKRNCLGAIKKTGAAERIRTSDPRITNALLYRLSYRGISAGRLVIPPLSKRKLAFRHPEVRAKASLEG